MNNVVQRMMKCRVQWVGIVLLVGATIDAYPLYQTYIPNGDKVPNPCLTGTAWPGVGHLIPGGTGERNPFGLDFADKQHNWTAVCPLDSDRDGRTNGQELGDPNCTWTTSKPVPRSSNITHPGICEPLNSPNCLSRNSWLKCSPKFNCPATTRSDVLQLTVRFPPTPVPAYDTTYICFGVELPTDDDYHIIAMTPIIDTSQILHHMLLFICDNMADESILSRPETCGMAPNNCNTLIGIWGVGMSGYCANDQFGFLIGNRGFKYAILQLHWNNPGHVTNFVDSSGMTLYYTRTLRPNSGAVLITGQERLNIPPGLPSVSFSGSCPSRCSSALSQPLYLTDAFLHMHLLGVSGDLQLYRNGVLVQTFVNETHYDYNMPAQVQFPTPIEFRPGDELRVKCTFDSTSKTTSTYYGESTQDEMCYGFFTYYPIVPNILTCMDVDQCSSLPLDCAVNEFVSSIQRIQTVCRSNDCSLACKNLLLSLLDTGCLTGNLGELIAKYVKFDIRLLIQLAQKCGVPLPGGQESIGPTTTRFSSTTSVATSSMVATTSSHAILFASTFYLMRFVVE